MEQILIVSRDKEDADSANHIAIWPDLLQVWEKVTLSEEGEWYDASGGIMWQEELTPMEFREKYGLCTPEPGTMTDIRADIKWEWGDESKRG